MPTTEPLSPAGAAASQGSPALARAQASRPTGIDPRAPRFSASLTAVVLLVTLFLSLAGALTAATILLTIQALIFAWASVAGLRRHPWGIVFRKLVRPRLAPPTDLEDPAAPHFAQVVGLIVTGGGLVLALVGVPYAVPVAAAMAFIAAFLNAAFGYCLGCQLYVLLLRAGVFRANTGVAA